MKLWPCGFKIEYTHLGFASAGAVWLGIWNSDHVVLKLSIRTLASPWQQRSHWGLRVTQDVHFSLLTHSKQLLLLTFCDTAAETEVSVRTHERKRKRNGWADKRGSRNSYLDTNYEVSLISASQNRSLLESFLWHFSFITRKYPLCRYILGVLTHTTAWNWHWGGGENWSVVT